MIHPCIAVPLDNVHPIRALQAVFLHFLSDSEIQDMNHVSIQEDHSGTITDFV
jgi:hypothetical protein